MNVAKLIQRATEAGIEIVVGQNGILNLSAAHKPPSELLADLATYKTEIISVLSAANESHPPPHAWFHLLLLADGQVIQRAGNSTTERMKETALKKYKNDLITVVAVTGFNRFLTDREIIKALAGTLDAPKGTPLPSGAWLARIARLVGIPIEELLEYKILEQHDLIELSEVNASLVAESIRQKLAWSKIPKRIEQLAIQEITKYCAPQHFVATMASALPEQIQARDQQLGHVMSCKACHAPTNRYCTTGTALRQQYNDTLEISNETEPKD